MQTPVPVPVTPPLCMQDGDTALIKAIVLGNSAMTELLIECGANKDHQNKVNRTRVPGILFGWFIPCMIMPSVFVFGGYSQVASVFYVLVKSKVTIVVVCQSYGQGRYCA